MADSLSPQVPPAPGRMYGADQRRLWRATEQLQRQRVTMPATPAAASGGPVGIVDVYSVNGTVTTDGAADMLWGSVEYQTPIVRAGDGSWLSVSGYELVVSAAGFYHPVAQFVIGWPDGSHPDYVDCYMQAGVDNAHQDSDMAATFKSGTSRGVYRFVDHGPTYLDAGGTIHAEAQWGPATAAAFTSFGGGARINWTITKLA